MVLLDEEHKSRSWFDRLTTNVIYFLFRKKPSFLGEKINASYPKQGFDCIRNLGQRPLEIRHD